MDPPAVIGGRIRRLREQRGWSQYDLAREANTTNVTVGRLERGENAPQWKTAAAVAEALGVTPEELLGDQEAQQEQLDRIEATLSELKAHLAQLTELIEGEGEQLPGPPEGGPLPLREASASPTRSTDGPEGDSDT